MPRRLTRFFLGDPRLFLRYVATGAASAGLEFALFALAYQVLAWPLLAANAFALACALALNFALHRRWTFRAEGALGTRLRRYALMQGVAALLDNALVYLFIARWGWPAAPAKALQIGLVFLWNFSAAKLVVFAPLPDPRA